MNKLLSYCGLVDARKSACEKDLPVLHNKHGFECNRLKTRVKKLPFKNNMKRTAWWENKLEIFLHIA